MWLTPPLMNSEITLLARGGEMRLLRRVRVGAGAFESHEPARRAQQAVLIEQMRQRQAAQAAADWKQKIAPTRSSSWLHLTYRNSFKFSSTCVKSTSLCFFRISTASAVLPAPAAARAPFVGHLHLLGRIVRRRLFHPVGEQLCLPQHPFVVEQRQRLRRHRGYIAPPAAQCSDPAGRTLRTSGTAGRVCGTHRRCAARLRARPLRVPDALVIDSRTSGGLAENRRAAHLGFSAPLTARIESRTISASSRWMRKRHR